VEISKNSAIQKITIYNISGQLMEIISDINLLRYNYDKKLRQGTYLLVIQADDNKIIHKKLVVL
jgi:hypothetical protein